MSVLKIEIKNFRLLKDVTISLDERTTVIVGRNNSGKTSLTELFRRLLSGQAPSFGIEDFSLAEHRRFWAAFHLKSKGEEEGRIRKVLPIIEVKLTIGYEEDATSLGPLAEFIVDLDPESKVALAVIRYQPRKAILDKFFKDIDKFSKEKNRDEQKREYFRIIRERVQESYEVTVQAVDPKDPSNQKPVNRTQLDALLHTQFISAQRGLDDITHKERDDLSKVLEALWEAAVSDSANVEHRQIAEKLKKAVQDVQKGINNEFDEQLKDLLPALSLFGYPGLTDPSLLAETTLDVQRLLRNHTRVCNAGVNGINLPEAYNGLGARNLIFILFRLVEYFRSYNTKQPQPSLHLVFIEEPEVHLHPQMQEVFISKLNDLANKLERDHGCTWPVKFVVTTHSSHLANKAPFDAIRYFRAAQDGPVGSICKTEIKDLGQGLGNKPKKDVDFLHKYMTLTRCDLLFADKAVLIEGLTERLMLPVMIKKVEEKLPDEAKLSSQYISVVEVGGAYAHVFFDLLEFLELRTLVITDLDAAQKKTVNNRTVRTKCKVSEGDCTTNGCITKWFKNGKTIQPDALLEKTENEKTRGILRLAYQVPETVGTKVPCGRSFEDAFILANADLFGLDGLEDSKKESQAYEKVDDDKKSDFALEYAIEKLEWNVPRYIKEGLLWLAEGTSCQIGSPSPPTT